MRRGAMLEFSISLIVVVVVGWAIWQARSLIVYFGYTLLILAAVAIVVLILKYWTKHEVIQNSHRGAYVQRHGRIVRLEPLVQPRDTADSVSRIPVQQRYESVESDGEESPWTAWLEPTSDEDTELDPEKVVVAAYGTPDESDIGMALRLWKQGANSVRLLSSSMTVAKGEKVSQRKANQLIAELRRRKEL